jgi:hypothetical protein
MSFGFLGESKRECIFFFELQLTFSLYSVSIYQTWMLVGFLETRLMRFALSSMKIPVSLFHIVDHAFSLVYLTKNFYFLSLQTS